MRAGSWSLTARAAAVWVRLGAVWGTSQAVLAMPLIHTGWALCDGRPGPTETLTYLDRTAQRHSAPFADPLPSLPSDPFKPFIIFSNRHEIRRIDLHKGDYSVLVPGLRNTIALDFHLSQSALYWTDVVEDKIYRGKLLDNGGDALGLGVVPGWYTDGTWAFRVTDPDPGGPKAEAPVPHPHPVNWVRFCCGSQSLMPVIIVSIAASPIINKMITLSLEWPEDWLPNLGISGSEGKYRIRMDYLSLSLRVT